MQRIQKRLAAGLIPGLFLISAAPAQAQISYVQSAGFCSVRVSPIPLRPSVWSQSHR